MGDVINLVVGVVAVVLRLVRPVRGVHTGSGLGRCHRLGDSGRHRRGGGGGPAGGVPGVTGLGGPVHRERVRVPAVGPAVSGGSALAPVAVVRPYLIALECHRATDAGGVRADRPYAGAGALLARTGPP